MVDIETRRIQIGNSTFYFEQSNSWEAFKYLLDGVAGTKDLEAVLKKRPKGRTASIALQILKLKLGEHSTIVKQIEKFGIGAYYALDARVELTDIPAPTREIVYRPKPTRRATEPKPARIIIPPSRSRRVDREPDEDELEEIEVTNFADDSFPDDFVGEETVLWKRKKPTPLPRPRPEHIYAPSVEYKKGSSSKRTGNELKTARTRNIYSFSCRKIRAGNNKRRFSRKYFRLFTLFFKSFR